MAPIPEEAGVRPRRSVLYLPGANERALEKAKTLPTDAVVLDLEDAVAPERKDRARDHVCEAVRSGAYDGREVAIRINGIGTRWHDADLDAVADAGPDAVVIPKVGSASDVHRIERALTAAGAPPGTDVWAMIETPAAVLRAQEIATASDRLTVLVLGTNDLANELHAHHVPGRAPLITSLSLCLLAARAAGKSVLDGVFNDVRDLEGFEAECVQARRFGFDGKTLVHPDQIGPCNRVFSPSAADIAHAQRVVEAFERALADGRGVVTVDGRMVENLHVEQARRVLALAEAGTTGD